MHEDWGIGESVRWVGTTLWDVFKSDKFGYMFYQVVVGVID